MEKIQISNKQGQRLAGLTSGLKQEHTAILLNCHGFRGAKENNGRLPVLADKLGKINIALFAFDFSGNGESEGEFASITLSRQVEEVGDMLDYLHSISELPIILQGRSFGGATAIAAAAIYKQVQAVSLWSTLVHLEATFRHMLGYAYSLLLDKKQLLLPGDPDSFMLKSDILQDFANHDMKKYLQMLKDIPCLIVHGLADEVVLPDNAQYVKSLIPAAELHFIAGADHSFTGMEAIREDLTVEFLQKLF